MSTLRRLAFQRFVRFFSSRWKRRNRLWSGHAVPLTFPSSPPCQRTHLSVSFATSGASPAPCAALGLRPEAGCSSATARKGRRLAVVQNLCPRACGSSGPGGDSTAPGCWLQPLLASQSSRAAVLEPSQDVAWGSCEELVGLTLRFSQTPVGRGRLAVVRPSHCTVMPASAGRPVSERRENPIGPWAWTQRLGPTRSSGRGRVPRGPPTRPGLPASGLRSRRSSRLQQRRVSCLSGPLLSHPGQQAGEGSFGGSRAEPGQAGTPLLVSRQRRLTSVNSSEPLPREQGGVRCACWVLWDACHVRGGPAPWVSLCTQPPVRSPRASQDGQGRPCQHLTWTDSHLCKHSRCWSVTESRETLQSDEDSLAASTGRARSAT